MSHRLNQCRLYGFVDLAYLEGRDPQALTRALIDGGVDLLQVRAKTATPAERVQLALAVIGVAMPRGVPVIINDDLETACATNADGVHLGQEDWAALPPGEREARLAPLRIVGLSTHSLAQAQQAVRDGADYIGVGPVFATATKPGMPPVGLELVQQVAAQVTIPFFAIGGITLDTLAAVRQAGAQRVAVVSAILRAENVKQAAQAFKRRLQ